MSSPDPETLGLIAKIGGVLAAAAAPIVWVHRQLDSKADKTEVARCLGHIESLYKNAEIDRKLTRDLHDSAMKEIHENQTELIRIVAKQQ